MVKPKLTLTGPKLSGSASMKINHHDLIFHIHLLVGYVIFPDVVDLI
jgi:hypothetical protein